MQIVTSYIQQRVTGAQETGSEWKRHVAFTRKMDVEGTRQPGVRYSNFHNEITVERTIFFIRVY